MDEELGEGIYSLVEFFDIFWGCFKLLDGEYFGDVGADDGQHGR